MSLRTASVRFATAVLILAAGTSACETNVNGPSRIEESEVVGEYVATTLTTVIRGSATDQLALGAELEMELLADGTTRGRLLAPEGGPAGSDLDERLRGTWSFDVTSQSVAVDHPTDTFLRSMVFEAQRSGDAIELRSESALGLVNINTVLRQR